MEIKLGLKYRDTETGYIGTATSRSEFLHGEPLVYLENETGHRWFEEIRLLPVEGEKGLQEVVSETSALPAD